MQVLEAIECVVCKQLHKKGSSGWVALWGGWEVGVKMNRSSDSHTVAQSITSAVPVCNRTECVLKALKLAEGQY